MSASINYLTPTMHCWRNSVFSKLTAIATAICFSAVFYISPTAKVLASELNNQASEQRIRKGSNKLTLSQQLQSLKTHLNQQIPALLQQASQPVSLTTRLSRVVGLERLPIDYDELDYYVELQSTLQQAYTAAMVKMDRDAEAIISKLSDSSMKQASERHKNVRQQVTDKFETLLSLLETITTTTERQEQLDAISLLNQFMAMQQFQPHHTAEDPNQLPWGYPDHQIRQPAESPYELDVHIFSSQTRIMMAMSEAADSALSETIEVQLTDDIRSLAEKLNHNPTEIYAWVHNNIRFIPSYGSIQGAQQTLDNLSGNATDTASLLIALLRASDIPARYVFGTVEVPAEKVMNWVGRVNSVAAAQNLMGQGGIPNTGIQRGGVISDIRFEHTWVEAWVDFEPSRGVNNKAGDNWIPMDASFKQYDYAQQANVTELITPQVGPFWDAITKNATINSEEGWIQAVPSQQVDEQYRNLQASIDRFIAETHPNNAIGDILGSKKLRKVIPRPLSAGLPYHRLFDGKSTTEVPGNLRHKFSYNLSANQLDYPGESIIELIIPTAELAGKNLALSFSPLTENDKDIIFNSLPGILTTEDIDLASVPEHLPGYLINLKAEFTIDSKVIYSSASGSMGSELKEKIGLWSPSHGWRIAKNNAVSGQYRAIALNLQGMNSEQLKKVRNNIALNQKIIQEDNDGFLDYLNKYNTVGEVLQGVILNYFTMNDAFNDHQANMTGFVAYRLPSFGVFSTSLSPQYWFGIPRNVKLSGMNMDVDLLQYQIVEKNNNAEKVNAFTNVAGSRASAFEHLLPEQMLSTQDSPVQSISAIKALALANAGGQKIWTITQSNLELSLSAIHLDSDVKKEIRNAVLGGSKVTTHDNMINYAGWYGAGYIIQNEQKGATAYKISGGTNGGDTLPGNLLTASGGLLGITDGYINSKYPFGKPWFSKVLKKLWGQGKLSGYAGYLGLGISILLVLIDDSLSATDKLGQISMNMLGFGITAYLITALAVGTVISPVIVAVLGLIIAVSIALAVGFINTYYFTFRKRHYNKTKTV